MYEKAKLTEGLLAAAGKVVTVIIIPDSGDEDPNYMNTFPLEGVQSSTRKNGATQEQVGSEAILGCGCVWMCSS